MVSSAIVVSEFGHGDIRRVSVDGLKLRAKLMRMFTCKHLHMRPTRLIVWYEGKTYCCYATDYGYDKRVVTEHNLIEYL